MNADLPAFVVRVSSGAAGAAQPLPPRLWGSGFLPSEHQGVRFRTSGDPVLCLSNPAGVTDAIQKKTIDSVGELNKIGNQHTGDPEILARIKSYELAYRMQASVPDLLDANDEPQHVYDLYGPASKQRGTFAANCLMARRLVERGVRFVQLYHTKWDHHGNLPNDLPKQCADVDQ